MKIIFAVAFIFFATLSFGELQQVDITIYGMD